jgi:hypothetical protein
MPKKIELIEGQEFGNLIVVDYYGKSPHGKSMWNFKCKLCNSVTPKIVNNVICGQPDSCGCKQYDNCATTHGMTGTKVYRTWLGIRNRCNNSNDESYKDYGARGIKVCERWNNFENFYIDMGEPIDEKLTIERKDNNGDYCPENCVWTTRKRQNNNKRNNTFITYNNKTQTLSDWADELGIESRTLWYRYQNFNNLDDVFNPKVIYHPIRLIKYNGKEQSVSAWAKEIGVSKPVILRRLNNGATPEEALAPLDKEIYSEQMITYNGKTQNVADWAKELNMRYSTIYRRLKQGKTPEEIFKPTERY